MLMHSITSISNSWITRPLHRSKGFCFLILTILGIVGNIFKIQLFYNVDFIFGSIFSMLVLQSLGRIPGILAAAIVSSWTLVLWNHPYNIIIQSLEMIVVGWLISRKRMTLVVSDILYWCIIGMPIVLVFHSGVLNASFHDSMLLMIKQTINAILNVQLARWIFIGYQVYFRDRGISIREFVFNVSLTISLLPITAMIIVESRMDMARLEARLKRDLQIQSQNMVQDINTWIHLRKSGVKFLANRIHFDLDHMQTLKDLFKNYMKSIDHYAVLMFLDLDGNILIAEGFFDPNESIVIEPAITNDRGTFIRSSSINIDSDSSRSSGIRTAAAFLEPVISGGIAFGYVKGISFLDPIREKLESSHYEKGTFYSVIDKNEKVIFSNRPKQQIFKFIDREEGSVKSIDSDILLWVPLPKVNAPIMERWKYSVYIVTKWIDELSGWRLVLEKSFEPYRTEIIIKHTKLLYLFFGFLLITLTISSLVVYLFDRFYAQLQGIAQNILEWIKNPSKILREKSWPQTRITEHKKIIDDLATMLHMTDIQYRELRSAYDTLRDMISQLRASNIKLEQEIEARLKIEAQLQQLLSEKEILLKEIHHRVKNNLAAIVGLIDLQSQNVSEYDFQDSLRELGIRIRSMALVHEQLYHTENLSLVDFKKYIQFLIDQVNAVFGVKKHIQIRIDVSDVKMSIDDAIPCGLIVTELLTNAFKYAFPPQCDCNKRGDCSIDIQVKQDGDMFTLCVSDNGIGLPSPPDWNEVKTLGLMLVKMLGQHQLRGEIEVACTSGTSIRVAFHASRLGQISP